MIKRVAIYGERCSGTNYLEELLKLNFGVEITCEYGWKHFFGFNNLEGSDDVLFIGIVRNLEDWVNSFFREKHHVPKNLCGKTKFLTGEFYSVNNDNSEIMTDRNIETSERYKNLFELRHIKNKFLVEKMPTLVKNYCLITYDDLVKNFVNVMNKIQMCGLSVKNNNFPENIFYYKTNKNKKFVKKQNRINKEEIYSLANLHYEKILFPELFPEIN